MSRMDDLLGEAAEAFADGRDPFSTEWLSDHEVTLDECMALSDRIASVLRGYLAAPRVVREAFPLFAAEDLSPAEKEHAFHGLYEIGALRSVSDHLKSVGTPEASEARAEPPEPGEA